jgi:hypothetical protein
VELAAQVNVEHATAAAQSEQVVCALRAGDVVASHLKGGAENSATGVLASIAAAATSPRLSHLLRGNGYAASGSIQAAQAEYKAASGSVDELSSTCERLAAAAASLKLGSTIIRMVEEEATLRLREKHGAGTGSEGGGEGVSKVGTPYSEMSEALAQAETAIEEGA